MTRPAAWRGTRCERDIDATSLRSPSTRHPAGHRCFTKEIGRHRPQETPGDGPGATRRCVTRDRPGPAKGAVRTVHLTNAQSRSMEFTDGISHSCKSAAAWRI